jgi:hypothetical protein
MPAIAPKSISLQCPSCRWDWNDVPRPTVTLDTYPVAYTCPNRKCTQRHWVMLYRMTFFPSPRWIVAAVARSFGPDPASLRDSLRQFPQLTEAAIDAFVAIAELRPEMAIGAA